MKNLFKKKPVIKYVVGVDPDNTPLDLMVCTMQNNINYFYSGDGSLALPKNFTTFSKAKFYDSEKWAELYCNSFDDYFNPKYPNPIRFKVYPIDINNPVEPTIINNHHKLFAFLLNPKSI